MKVKELITALSKLDDDMEIILSKDAEGNGYAPLHSLTHQIYAPNTRYSGDIYMLKLTDDLIAMGYSDEDLYHGDDGQEVIVLWP